MNKNKLSENITSYVGDIIEVLKTFPEKSIHCCITSPPYFNLRKYLPNNHFDKYKEIGTESTIQEYVRKIEEVCKELWRVLRDDGTFWLNLGDSYASSPPGCKGMSSNSTLKGINSKSGTYRARLEEGSGKKSDTSKFGIPSKNLLAIPWETAIALRESGWYLRSGIPWVKRNAMPESANDRPTTSLEYIFMFSKEPHYFYDPVAVKKPLADSSKKRLSQNIENQIGTTRANGGMKTNGNLKACGGFDGRNRRNSDWWFESVGMLLAEDDEMLGIDVCPQSYKGAHFACFPEKLIEPMILAGTSEKGVCVHCGSPWKRQIQKTRIPTRPANDTKIEGQTVEITGNRDPLRHITQTETTGWKPTCNCNSFEVEPATVLDMFGGSGTTAAVCERLKRKCILIDLNEDYVKLQQKRINEVKF